MYFVKDLDKKELDGELYLDKFKVRVNLDKVTSNQLLNTRIIGFVNKIEKLMEHDPSILVDEFLAIGLTLEICKVNTEAGESNEWKQLFPDYDFHTGLHDSKLLMKEFKKCNILYIWLQKKLYDMLNEVSKELDEESKLFQ